MAQEPGKSDITEPSKQENNDFMKELLIKGLKEKSIQLLMQHDVDSLEALKALDLEELPELNLSVGQKAVLRKIKLESENKAKQKDKKKRNGSTEAQSEQKIVNNKTNNATEAKSAAWQWRSDDGTGWTSYPADVSVLLEQLYQQGVQSIDLSLTTSKLPYTLDLKRMRQTRNDSGTKRPIRRKITSQDDQSHSQGLAASHHDDVTYEPASFPLWEWQGESADEWEIYTEKVAEYLEQQHSQGVQAVDLSQTQFKLPYKVDFQKMTQTRNNTGKVRKIRRTVLTDHPVAVYLERPRHNNPSSPVELISPKFPTEWEPMHNQTFTTPDVAFGSTEYRKVEGKFLQTMRQQGNTTVLRITRIQNIMLWEFYNVKKKQMVDQLGPSGVNERQLFHGTKRSAIESICKNNFDWRLSGTNGTSYGQGSYFAVEATYSHQFTESSPPNQSTLSIMKKRLTNPNMQGAYMQQLAYNQPYNQYHNQPYNQYHNQPYNQYHNQPYNQYQSQNVHKMFMANVLCGKYTRGNSNMRTPPPINSVNNTGPVRHPSSISAHYQRLQINRYLNPNQWNSAIGSQGQQYGGYDDDVYSLQGQSSGPFFDSCVDDVNNPRVFVIFEKTQCYPAYIIEYTCN